MPLSGVGGMAEAITGLEQVVEAERRWFPPSGGAVWDWNWNAVCDAVAGDALTREGCCKISQKYRKSLGKWRPGLLPCFPVFFFPASPRLEVSS